MRWAVLVVMVAALVDQVTNWQIQFTLGSMTYVVGLTLFLAPAFGVVCLVAVVAGAVRWWRSFRS
jgi:uncharacterized membrane protein HdeD (DUF308 family)